jgi:DNA-binding XRE family transcriptional regulator
MKAIQLRMARAAVGWGVRELAKKAGVTANTVTRIENGAGCEAIDNEQAAERT